MGDRYVILRRPRGASRGTLRGGGELLRARATGTGSDGLSVQVDEVAGRGIRQLEDDDDVLAVAPVIPMKLIAPVRTGASERMASGNAAWGISAVGADTSPCTGKGVVVAVLDTGIDLRIAPGANDVHPAFDGLQIETKNFTQDVDHDEDGHGTHCAGTIFGRPIGGLRIGVAPGVKKALIGKVLGPTGGSSAQIVDAIRWALDNGAHVISMSLGMDFPGLVEEFIAGDLPPALATSRALEGYRANVRLFERLAAFIDAHEDIGRQPAIIVGAAGNESQKDVNPEFAIGVSPPAVADGIISVAALERGKGGLRVAPFSNVGATVAGPGVDIVSAGRSGGRATMSGTSMAAPHVAGVAALWAERLRGSRSLTNRLLKTKVVGLATTRGLHAGFVPRDVGAGLVRAPQGDD